MSTEARKRGRWIRFLRWPARPDNCLVPWYVVLRRVVFAPLVYAGLLLTFGSLLLGWGRVEALRFWHDSH